MQIHHPPGTRAQDAGAAALALAAFALAWPAAAPVSAQASVECSRSWPTERNYAVDGYTFYKNSNGIFNNGWACNQSTITQHVNEYSYVRSTWEPFGWSHACDLNEPMGRVISSQHLLKYASPNNSNWLHAGAYVETQASIAGAPNGLRGYCPSAMWWICGDANVAACFPDGYRLNVATTVTGNVVNLAAIHVHEARHSHGGHDGGEDCAAGMSCDMDYCSPTGANQCAGSDSYHAYFFYKYCQQAAHTTSVLRAYSRVSGNTILSDRFVHDPGWRIANCQELSFGLNVAYPLDLDAFTPMFADRANSFDLTPASPPTSWSFAAQRGRGDVGTSFRFDGVQGHHFETPDAPGLDPATLTVAAWVKLDSTSSEQWIISKYTADKGQRSWFMRYLPNQGFNFGVSRDGNTNSQVTAIGHTVNPNEWHFVVGRYNPLNGIVRVRVDAGSTYSFHGPSGAIRDSASPIRLGVFKTDMGGSTTAKRLKGYLDAIHMWILEIPEDEVMELYNWGLGMQVSLDATPNAPKQGEPYYFAGFE